LAGINHFDRGTIMRSRLLLVLVALPLLLVLALPAVASAGVPRLLGGMYGAWTIRPSGIAGITGIHNTAYIGSDGDGRGAISWTRWNARKAVGVGKMWINDLIPGVAQGHFHGHAAHILAFRVRHGHYTRLTVSWHAGPRTWDAGTILYTWRFRLMYWSAVSHLMWARMS